MIEILKGVPIPTRSGGGRPRKYPLAEMQVGDCFFVERTWLTRIQGAVQAYSAKHGVRFSVRQTEHEGEPVVGCWRIS